jgi:ribose transport system substrate-binding protein
MVNGVPGTSVDTERQKGAQSVWKKNSGIKVIAKFAGLWDQAATQQGMAGVLSARHDIDGVWSQVGFGIVQAYRAAGRKMVPMVGESANGFRSAMVDGEVEGISYGSPPCTGAYALKVAVPPCRATRCPGSCRSRSRSARATSSSAAPT